MNQYLQVIYNRTDSVPESEDQLSTRQPALMELKGNFREKENKYFRRDFSWN